MTPATIGIRAFHLKGLVSKSMEKEFKYSKSIIEQSLIKLPIPKRYEEVDMVDHPKYCKYYWIVVDDTKTIVWAYPRTPSYELMIGYLKDI
ncbi:hypothetical protein SADUNF_Sadunf18G0042900 [Salix dunnii]|uniref:Uncharacterized protein n=1 Tax=Salix dunnii TaxID=1413687 RepID=A0A835J0I9_9ROSI|nr:hypothetical protein SADUNF_Sadunf18G0042900 [Salix dunnii]